MPPRGTVRIEGERVVLRAFEPEEVEPALQALRDATGFVQPLEARGVARVRRRLAGSGRFSRGTILLAIDAGGRVVGDVEARGDPTMFPAGVHELGIVIYDPADRGRGFGTEAVSLLTEWLFARGAERVQAGTAFENAPMRKAFERLGFRMEGVMRSFMPRGDDRDDYALYARTRRESPSPPPRPI